MIGISLITFALHILVIIPWNEEGRLTKVNWNDNVNIGTVAKHLPLSHLNAERGESQRP